FIQRNIMVIEPKLVNRVHFSGTEIRRRMLKNIRWTQLVPEQTFRIIEKVNGVDRVKKISNSFHHKKI
ncbi:MAG: nicotinamide-nucleotide adenylyltransferase, partial [Thermoproteota archaeon]|nr:nicotinamide-nucleotide adenylyltransferase [Thermoproteota archaeon]